VRLGSGKALPAPVRALHRRLTALGPNGHAVPQDMRLIEAAARVFHEWTAQLSATGSEQLVSDALAEIAALPEALLCTTHTFELPQLLRFEERSTEPTRVRLESVIARLSDPLAQADWRGGPGCMRRTTWHAASNVHLSHSLRHDTRRTAQCCTVSLQARWVGASRGGALKHRPAQYMRSWHAPSERHLL
jgi:hypothetical protein